MLTKAGKQALQTVATWTTQTNIYNTVPMFPSSSIRNTANQERWVSYLNNNLISAITIQNNATNAGFHFGSGTTAATENDYKLESDITSGLTTVLGSSMRGVDSNGKPYMSFTFTVTNSGNSNITIGEIGLVSANVFCCTSSSATTAASNNVLIDRTVLDTPVTLAPNETSAIKYTITCDMSFT